ncbi:MAG: heterodisulfide reductase-related iron-sulfur binding cluster [Candidatus Altiarchaeota archaeon]
MAASAKPKEKTPFEKNIDNVRAEFRTANRLKNMKNGFDRMEERTAKTFEERGEQLRSDAEYIKKVRMEILANLEKNLKETVEAFKAKGFFVHGPYDAEGANKKVAELFEGEKFAVKGKSKVTKEIGLSKYLEGKGFEVVETDIGDRALQHFERFHEEMGLPPEKPRHASGPAIGMNRYDFAKVVAKAYDESFEGLTPDEVAAKEIRLLRQDVIRAYEKANIGITGANVLTRDGYAVIMHNEGNLGRVSMLAKSTGEKSKHIIITSIEKILPSLDDAIRKIRVESIYATGSDPSFLQIVGGPSKTADIERILFKGVSGPTEVHLVLVDNGRMAVAKDEEFRELLACVSCGRCVFHCPTYRSTGPAFGFKGYPGGIGVMQACLYPGDPEAAVENGLYLCTTCKDCALECPMDISAAEIIPKLRVKALEKNLFPDAKAMRKTLSKYKNVYAQDNKKMREGIERKGISKKSDTLFFVGCTTAFKDQDTANTAIKILSNIGVDFTILDDEPCCGELLKLWGDEKGFEDIVKENKKVFKDARVKKIITACPSCYETLSTSLGDEIEVKHFTQVLAENLDKIKFKKGKKERVTWHDPCRLSRYMDVIDEPRKIINAIPGVEFVELKRSKEDSDCCGAGGGLFAAFSRLSYEIGKERFAQAEEAKVDTLITCCPGCKLNLKNVSDNKKSPIRVVNLPEFIFERLA